MIMKKSCWCTTQDNLFSCYPPSQQFSTHRTIVHGRSEIAIWSKFMISSFGIFSITTIVFLCPSVPHYNLPLLLLGMCQLYLFSPLPVYIIYSFHLAVQTGKRTSPLLHYCKLVPLPLRLDHVLRQIWCKALYHYFVCLLSTCAERSK